MNKLICDFCKTEIYEDETHATLTIYPARTDFMTNYDICLSCLTKLQDELFQSLKW